MASHLPGHRPMERRLAAILAADVVGYSRLMERDEAATLAALTERRKGILKPLVVRYHGRIFKLMGDEAFVEFASAVNAVECAVALQDGMSKANARVPASDHILLRIGINLGDVVVEGRDLYGDGVILAKRLQGFAEPGGICISRNLHEQVSKRLTFGFEDLGEREVKNIATPVRIYRVRTEAPVGPRAPLGPPERPSIAVLPFANYSGDPGQQYFSDGITEDIITELSRWRQLQVFSRHATFRYREKSTDAKEVHRELGAQYLVEGSVRRVGERIRITAQLIDTRSGSHVWAERYDREMSDVITIQDDVVRTIVGTLVGRVQAAGAEHARRRPPASLAAYDCVLRGHALPWGDPEADAEARRLYEKAIELDPGYGLAHALLALMMYAEWNRDTTGSDAALDRAFELAKKAVELDENESYCHFMLGQVYLFRRSFDLAEQYHRRAVEMNPNNPEHLADMGGLLLCVGRPEEALEWLHKARRVDPYFGPAWYWHQMGMAHFVAHHYEEAIAAFERSPTMPHWVHAWVGACHAYLGRGERAKKCVAESLRRQPNYSVAICAAKHPFKNPADLDHLRAGLREAGLPE
ncbi:adenylate/guanylate cyclase domain-containing protein [Dongia deserti]|uniref:adenylate/guanylate cyclase domain-containing protein n=1 Tax=Dongia deserti TaxID=2268030 RepID=UPI000E65A085|nr:adenylate/guanylate cyclase domain-containing protein [Dongia deserti]